MEVLNFLIFEMNLSKKAEYTEATIRMEPSKLKEEVKKMFQVQENLNDLKSLEAKNKETKPKFKL